MTKKEEEKIFKMLDDIGEYVKFVEKLSEKAWDEVYTAPSEEEEKPRRISAEIIDELVNRLYDIKNFLEERFLGG